MTCRKTFHFSKRAWSGPISNLYASRNATNSCNVTYGNTTSNNFPTGSNSFHTAPPGDTTAYLSVGPHDGNNIVATLLTQANYFGFFTGVMNSSDLVQFFLGNVLVDFFTGDDINAVAFPNNNLLAPAPSAFINYFPTLNNFLANRNGPNSGTQQAFYDRIVFSTSQNSLETDNHAFGVVAFQTPEPGSVALLGLGALALLTGRRRRTAS